MHAVPSMDNTASYNGMVLKLLSAAGEKLRK